MILFRRFSIQIPIGIIVVWESYNVVKKKRNSSTNARTKQEHLKNYLRCAVVPCNSFGTFTGAVNEDEMKRIPCGLGEQH
ncbi:MAG: hypothetical protein JXR82_15680 [Marinifilaceae bacterium]|nr:hypothetical protein [Marinifilaceae bacterium]